MDFLKKILFFRTPEQDCTGNISNQDQELDDLLDNALSESSSTSAATGSQANPLDDEVWNKNQTAPGQDLAPKLDFRFDKIRDAACRTIQSNDEELTSVEPEFIQRIKDAQKGLSEGTDIDTLAMQLNAEGITSVSLKRKDEQKCIRDPLILLLISTGELLPMVIKLDEKYPKWLEENSGNIGADEKKRYEKQLQINKTIRHELEQAKESDSADVKKQRLNKVLEEARKMGDLGEPPRDIEDEFELSYDDERGSACLAALGVDPAECITM